MDELCIKRMDEIPAYEGEYEIPGIRFRHAAKALGVSAWGMNVLDLDPHVEGYPVHDHVSDGQEEVYFIVRGGGAIDVDGERFAVEEGMLVRVGPALKRKLLPDARGMRVLALGATPGKAFVTTLGGE